MRKHALAIVLAVVLALTLGALVGCSPSSEEPEIPAEEDTGVTYETMEMDANAKAALEAMPASVDEYVAYAVEDAEVEGEDYLDVSGIEPVFVGYEVIAWEPIEGTDDVEYIEVSYINGRITNGYAAPDTQMTSAPEIYEFQSSNVREMPSNPSAGELAAVDAAQAKLAEFYDDLSATQWGIKRYLFLYEKDGQGVVLGMTADGELGSSSMPIDLKQ